MQTFVRQVLIATSMFLVALTWRCCFSEDIPKNDGLEMRWIGKKALPLQEITETRIITDMAKYEGGNAIIKLLTAQRLFQRQSGSSLYTALADDPLVSKSNSVMNTLSIGHLRLLFVGKRGLFCIC